MNAIVKDNFIVITSKTDVAMSKEIDVPESVRSAAPPLTPFTQVQEMAITTALESPEKTLASVKGKIIKVSEADTRSFDDKVIPYQELVIKDSTGSSTVAIWDKMVNQFSTGQLVKFSKCKVRLFAQKKRLTTVAGGSYELINEDQELAELSEDEDTSDDIQDTLVSGSIIALFEMDPYLACPNKTCCNKKLATIKEHKYVMLCPTCNNRFSASACHWYARASVLFQQDGKSTKLSLFKPEIQKILVAKQQEGTVGLDRDELFQKFYNLLPLDVKCMIANNTIRNITCKRLPHHDD